VRSGKGGTSEGIDAMKKAEPSLLHLRRRLPAFRIRVCRMEYRLRGSVTDRLTGVPSLEVTSAGLRTWQAGRLATEQRNGFQFDLPNSSVVVTGLYSNITVLRVPTITVKLDSKRAARIARWARRKKVTKSQIIRALIDSAGPVATGDDLIDWVKAFEGKSLGRAQRKR
jgi:hypothetical protein